MTAWLGHAGYSVRKTRSLPALPLVRWVSLALSGVRYTDASASSMRRGGDLWRRNTDPLAHVTERLDHAISLLADTDVEQVQRAYEVTRECTEQLARSIWFLRRAGRVDEDASAS